MRPQFSLKAMLGWLSLLAVGCAAIRWASIGEMPISGRTAVFVVVGAIYGGAVVLLAND